MRLKLYIFPALLLSILFGFRGLTDRNIKSSVPLLNEGLHHSSKYKVIDLVRYVNPICGTGDWNNTFPGADAPFGMIQWSPDTYGGRKHPGGYSIGDSSISDFSLDHISGAGCTYGENFGFMPILGDQPIAPPEMRSAFSAGFSHNNEIAKPGYYAVTLNNGLKVELTTTTRTGFGRFTYPGHSTATVMINAASNINGGNCVLRTY